MKRLVLGILAHVDSGKTTLSEGLLYLSGNINKLGRVDHGNAFLDTYALERERGITIFSKQAVLQLNEMELTLLDTPGHVDFSPEMERTLQVLDYACLVISGTDSLQSHTETLWRLLTRHRIPTFLFVNKMDLAGTDSALLMKELKHRLSDGCVEFSTDQKSEAFVENLAMCDEELLNRFEKTGTVTESDITSAIAACKVFPCYFGSALKLDGVDTLLEGLQKYTQTSVGDRAFGAKVFKISRDDQGNRLTYLKVTGKSLKVKALLDGITKENEAWAEKVNQIRIYSGAKFKAVEEAFAGTICAVTGLTKTYQGEGLGSEMESDLPTLSPVLTYRVGLPLEIDSHTALTKLRLLEEEEPQLHVVWSEPLQEIHIQLMGEVQMEVLKSLIWERFQIDVSFDQGSIVYKETITDEVEGVGHFEPLRHYAEVHLLLSPTGRGSGLSFGSSCSEDELDRSWQRLILTHLEEKVHLGTLTGSPITDMKITLVAAKAHQKHTEGGDFRQATYRAVRHGLKYAKSILLEPWYEFRLEVPTEAIGRAMFDLQRMNGSFAPPETNGNLSILTGSAPVAAMRDYQIELTNYTRGKGQLSCRLKGYEPCHSSDEVVSAIGYDSDSDIENTADSVFCAHGAGFTVKYDQVTEFMHLPLQAPKDFAKDIVEESKQPKQPFATRQAVDYSPTLADDKELLAIYERTYGTLRRNPQTSFRRVQKEVEVKTPDGFRGIPSGPEYLLVDGYNIIFSWDDLKAIARDSLDAARSQLINILCNYQGFRQCELILVFDAYKVKGNPSEVEKFHNISVVYTKEAETADMYIEKVTHELGKNRRVRVATSDGVEQLIIMGHGALRVSSTEFREEVEQVQENIRSFLKQ